MPGDLAVRPFNYCPKRVNLLISLPEFLLSRNEIGRMLCWGMLEESRWTLDRNLHVHRSVSLKYLRFPDQHIKGNIDSLIDAEKNKVLCGESLPQEKTHYPCMFIPFLTEKVSSFAYFPLKKWCPLKSHFSLHPLKLLWMPCPSLFLFLNCMNR